jgi:hypothetical protein
MAIQAIAIRGCIVVLRTASLLFVLAAERGQLFHARSGDPRDQLEPGTSLRDGACGGV